MKTFSILWIAAAIWGLTMPSFAAAEAVTPPAVITVAGKTLHWNGSGTRVVSMFNVKVWTSSLYLEVVSKNSEEILNSKKLKVIDLTPTYNISIADSVKGWKLSIDENCKPQCEKMKTDIDAFLASMPEFKKQDRYRYIFSEQGFEYTVNEKKIFSTTSQEFSRMLLACWIGPKPATEDSKKGLLAGGPPAKP